MFGHDGKKTKAKLSSIHNTHFRLHVGISTDIIMAADVAGMKHNQPLEKITSSRKSPNLFSRKFCRAHYALNTRHNPVRTPYACTLATDVPVSYSIRWL